MSTEDLTRAQFDALADGACPDCGGTIFRPGPRGGISQNIECVHCLARFNVARHPAVPAHGVVFAHRIPREADGGGEWREDMFRGCRMTPRLIRLLRSTISGTR